MTGGVIMKILFVIISFLFTLNAYALNCDGLRREVVQNDAIVKTEKLVKFFEIPGYVKFQADIDEAHFAVDLQGDQVTAYITLGPDYTTGNLSKGSLGEEGRIKLSYVTPAVTYILECFK